MLFNEVRLTNYFKKTYVEVETIRIMRDGKSVCNLPRYPINTWSCWDRLQDNIDRTNNVQESFHNTLQVAAENITWVTMNL